MQVLIVCFDILAIIEHLKYDTRSITVYILGCVMTSIIIVDQNFMCMAESKELTLAYYDMNTREAITKLLSKFNNPLILRCFIIISKFLKG